MKRIKALKNWCDIDQLEGVDLKDGEKLRVEFKDKTVEVVKIKVEPSSYETSDMGHPYTIPVRKAVVTKKVAGVTVQVPLVGLKAERIPNVRAGKAKEKEEVSRRRPGGVR